MIWVALFVSLFLPIYIALGGWIGFLMADATGAAIGVVVGFLLQLGVE